MTSRTTSKFAPEVRERAVRLVFDHSSRRTAYQSIAAKIGCSAHTLLDWVKRAGLPSDTAEKRYYATLEEPAIAA